MPAEAYRHKLIKWGRAAQLMHINPIGVTPSNYSLWGIMDSTCNILK